MSEEPEDTVSGSSDISEFERALNIKYEGWSGGVSKRSKPEDAIENKVDDALDNLSTQADFIAFVELLEQSAIEEPNKWDNSTTRHYLSGIAGWTGGMENWFKYRNIEIPKEPTWQLFGLILSAASSYD